MDTKITYFESSYSYEEFVSHSKFVFLLITGLYIISLPKGTTIALFDDNFTNYSFLMATIASVSFLIGFDQIYIKGRSNSSDLIRLFLYTSISLIVMLFVNVLIHEFIEAIDPLVHDPNNTGVIRRNSITYFIFTFTLIVIYYQILKFYIRRFHDLNVEGYHVLMMQVPLLHFVAGYLIFKQGKKLLGVLVFISFLASYLIIPFLTGMKEVNYFGNNLNAIKGYRKRKKAIENSKFLTGVERRDLLTELNNQYIVDENKALEAFKKSEFERMLQIEKENYLNILRDSGKSSDYDEINSKMEQFLKKKIEKKIEIYYDFLVEK